MIDYDYGVSLCTIDQQHLEMLRCWRNDEKIWRWCRQHDLVSDAQQRAWFDRIGSDPTIKMYMVRAGGMPVGVTGLTSIDQVNRRAEFSLYIAPSNQRQGFARKALKTLLAHAFLNLNLHVVWGESFDGNPALKLFDEIGFSYEGLRRDFYFRQGQYIDAHLISIKDSEWVAKFMTS